MNTRCALLCVCLALAGCSSRILPRNDSLIAGSAPAPVDADTRVVVEPVHLYPPSPLIGDSSAETKADDYCRARPLKEEELSQLAVSGFSQWFSKVSVSPTRSIPQIKRQRQSTAGTNGIRVIPSVLEVNCAIEVAQTSVFMPLMLYGHIRAAAPVTVRTQAIVLDEKTQRVLFVLEHEGEFEESVTTDFGILLLYSFLEGENGRPPEDAARAAFAGLAREVSKRLAASR